MAFKNGEFPLEDFIQVGFEQYLWKGTYHRWIGMVQDCIDTYGVRLRITAGWNGYRPLSAQWWAYNNLPAGQAAYPGTSSHGGIFEGQEAGAIDVANWGEIGWEAFAALCWKWGFQPGYFSWELWHIIDWNPNAVPAWANVKPVVLQAAIIVKDEFMRLMYCKDSGGSLWSLLNSSQPLAEGVNPLQTRLQSDADSWARSWGSSAVGSVQDFLNSLAAVRVTTSLTATKEQQIATLAVIEAVQAEVKLLGKDAANRVIGPDDEGDVIENKETPKGAV